MSYWSPDVQLDSRSHTPCDLLSLSSKVTTSLFLEAMNLVTAAMDTRLGLCGVLSVWILPSQHAENVNLHWRGGLTWRVSCPLTNSVSFSSYEVTENKLFRLKTRKSPECGRNQQRLSRVTLYAQRPLVSATLGKHVFGVSSDSFARAKEYYDDKKKWRTSSFQGQIRSTANVRGTEMG